MGWYLDYKIFSYKTIIYLRDCPSLFVDENKEQLHCEWIWSSSESSEIRWVTDDMCSRLTVSTQSRWRLLVPNPFRLWGQILRTFGKQENEFSRNAGGPRSRSVGRCRRGTCRWRHCVRPAKGTVSGVGEGLFIQRDEFRFLSPHTFRHLVTTPSTPHPFNYSGDEDAWL